MSETIDQPTAEQIAQHYSACMDSVNLINAGKPEGMTDAEWAACLSRNKEHLKIMLAKEFWTTEDLTPLRTAST
jgi:hypothetical protein